MAKVEIDITEEVEKEIQKQVEIRLDKGGILRFIRECIKTEFQNSGAYKQLNRQESKIAYIERRISKPVRPGVKKQ